MRRVCVTRRWKRARATPTEAASSYWAPSTASPSFQGKLYLVDLRVAGPGGPWSVPSPDLDVALGYLGRAAVPIQAYSGQYGPASLSVSPGRIPLSATAANGQYSDRDLQGWVEQAVAAKGLSAASAVLFINPPGLVNTDARESGGVGVLGYHGFHRVPYGFINALGLGFTMGDASDLFAEALSHEVAELTVDPQADNSRPEVCDGCGTNCQGASAFRSYFDASGSYLESANRFPPPFAYEFFISAIAQPAAVLDCPASSSACAYPPPAA